MYTCTCRNIEQVGQAQAGSNRGCRGFVICGKGVRQPSGSVAHWGASQCAPDQSTGPDRDRLHSGISFQAPPQAPGRNPPDEHFECAGLSCVGRRGYSSRPATPAHTHLANRRASLPWTSSDVADATDPTITINNPVSCTLNKTDTRLAVSSATSSPTQTAIPRIIV